ncbi:hypothetical protein ABIG06_006287 [Bradyrhizobium sp. USDA 326]|uniref:hypothetical protein n=1 Tax=unclassified Bradyrhizobium TaxID=2631580 RepID=UPI0035141D9A
MARRSRSKDTIAIYKELEKVVSKQPDGMCVYNGGADDRTVAEKLQVSPNSVARIRQDNFGKLRQQHEPDHRLDDLTRRVDEMGGALAQLLSDNADLHRVNRNLITSYDELKNKHDRLCDTLQINKVADVRHLKVVTQTHLQAHTNAQGRA